MFRARNLPPPDPRREWATASDAEELIGIGSESILRAAVAGWIRTAGDENGRILYDLADARAAFPRAPEAR